MAESVDALVSNTSGAIHPGSIPGLGTEQGNHDIMISLLLYNDASIIHPVPQRLSQPECFLHTNSYIIVTIHFS